MQVKVLAWELAWHSDREILAALVSELRSELELESELGWE